MRLALKAQVIRESTSTGQQAVIFQAAYGVAAAETGGLGISAQDRTS
ncbi:MAG: hypothetical protein R3E56_05170 [Burkholderiaceae bacterium]